MITVGLKTFLENISLLLRDTPGSPSSGKKRRVRSAPDQSTRYTKTGRAGLFDRPRWGRKLNGGV